MFSKFFSRMLSILQISLAKVQGIIFKNYDVQHINLFYRKYSRDNHHFAFSKSITEYAIKHNEKVEELKQNLDQESIELIDILLERYHYIYTHNVIELKKILTLEELKGDGDITKYRLEYKQTKKPILKNLDDAVFYYKHGLIFVPKEALHNLKDKDIIDGGAYIGDSAFMFEKDFKINRIHSFEPNSKNYHILKKSIKSNNLQKVIPVKAGLGMEKKLTKIELTGSSTSLFKQGSEEIQVTTIDDYVQENNLKIGVIKLDIEGYGLRAIMGAKNTIIKHTPILLLSIYHSSEEFFELKSYLDNLDLNYKIIIRKLGSNKPFYDTNLIAWVE